MKKYDHIIDELVDVNDEIMLADGLEEALIGYVSGCGRETVALYDEDLVIDILMRDGMDYDEAVEFYEFNILGAYVGEYTPMFAKIIL